MHCSHYLLDFLLAQGVQSLFLVPGLHLDPFMRHLIQHPIQAVLATHELGAAYMADGYARLSGGLGVVACIGGPGLSHLATGVLTSALEQVPLLVIAGAVPSHLLDQPFYQNTEFDERQAAFKAVFRPTHAAELPDMLRTAYFQAMSYPRGPVLLRLPYDIQDASLQASVPQLLVSESRDVDSKPFVPLWHKLVQAEKALVLIGDELSYATAGDALLNCLEALQLPVATTLNQKGFVPETHPLSLGNFGFAGAAQANAVWQREDLDLLLCLGVSWNERNTLNLQQGLQAQRVLSVSRQPPLISAVTEWIEADPAQCVQALEKRIVQNPPPVSQARQHWVSQVSHSRKSPEQKRGAALSLSHCVQELNSVLPAEVPLFADAGLSKGIAGLFWCARQPERFWVSYELGTMGWALGAAMGASFALRDRGLNAETAVLLGDGSLSMQGLELSTAVRYQLPLRVLLNDNQGLKTVSRRHHSPAVEAFCQLKGIHWNDFFRSLGVDTYAPAQQSEFLPALKQARQRSGPAALHLKIETQEAQGLLPFLRSAYA